MQCSRRSPGRSRTSARCALRVIAQCFVPVRQTIPAASWCLISRPAGTPCSSGRPTFSIVPICISATTSRGSKAWNSRPRAGKRPSACSTSRGIAVLDVNYRGSTGFGRAYRDRLQLNWGVVDVDDCVAGAQFLAAQGRVDGKRCVISGGSAGGYTTLAALTFRDFFQGGASYYGVSDVAALARDTHKFESSLSGRVGVKRFQTAPSILVLM